MEKTNVTYKKIATAMNVSLSTVSKALSGSKEVSSELSEQILKTAKEMGYFSQKRKRNREYAKDFCPRIAILIPEIISIFYSDLATKISDAIEKRGGKASIYITGFDSSYTNALLGQLYDEVHLSGIATLSGGIYSGKIKLPTISVSHDHAESTCIFEMNLKNGFREAIEHLVSLGHRRIGFVGEKHTVSKEAAFREMMQNRGLTIDERHIIRISDRFEKIGVEAGRIIAELDIKPTAMIAAYDEVAIGLISTLTSEGIRVPEDISVIGINNIPVSEYFNPPLTTISTCREDECTRAVDKLFEMIKQKELPLYCSRINYSSTLVVRESTAKARKD